MADSVACARKVALRGTEDEDVQSAQDVVEAEPVVDSGDEIRVDADSAEVVVPEPKVCLEKEESGINIMNEVPLVRTGAWGNALVRADLVRYPKEKISAAAPCTAEPSRRSRRAQENVDCIGGMRSPWRAVRRLPRLAWAAAKIRKVIEQEIDADSAMIDIVDWLGTEVSRGCENHKWLNAKAKHLSGLIVKTLEGRELKKDPLIGGAWDVELVSAFVDAAKDPEQDLVKWLQSGCPAGVAREITASGIFPITEDGEAAKTLNDSKLVEDEPANNYRSVEEVAELSGAEIDRLIEKGYAVKYDTWQDVTNAFGGVLVSKLACIVKEKEDGTRKVRNVLDLRRSGYNEVVKLKERIVLPRVQDLIGDARDLKRSSRAGELCYGMAADFEDAFHTLYVDPREWRYLVARHPEHGFVGYRTVLCGGAGCPLLWGRAAAFLGRSGQAMFGESELRTQIYVGDPATLVRGSLTTARRLAAALLWWWLALGLQIAWGKGVFGQEFRWIGVLFNLLALDSIVVSIPRSYADAVLELIAGIICMKAVPIEIIQRLAGKTGWAAGVAPVIWAQVAPLWAACADAAKLRITAGGCGDHGHGRTRPSKVGICRIMPSLLWLRALFASPGGELVRRVPVAEWTGPARIRFYVDASPWGGGAFLSVDGVPREYWYDAWTELDCKRFGVDIGCCKGQAIWEALALLISIRIWTRWWWDREFAIVAKSDSKAALGAFEKARSKSPHINAIAREFAYDVALATYDPQFIFEHVRGKNNEWADALSRMAEPEGGASIPGPLRSLSRARVPARGPSFWRTSGSPERAA